MGKLPILSLLLCTVLLSACGLFGSDESEASPEAIPATATPEPAQVVAGTPGAAPPVVVSQSSDTLRVWIPPELNPNDSAAAATLLSRILTFSDAHPDLAATVEFKQVGGGGGILSYLRSGRVVAPTVLPHLIALPTDQLASAAAEGLIFPLDGLIEGALLDDLYPAARDLSAPAGTTVGYPFALTGLTHLAYSSVITTTLPAVWDDMLAVNAGQLVFPAASREGAILALQFYLDLGGTLSNEAGQPSLELEILRQALEAFSQGRGANLIALQSSNVRGLDETWRLFQAGSVAITLTTAEQFLRARATELTPGYAPVPGPTGALNPMVTGWAWAITSPDPAHRQLAVDLLTALVQEPAVQSWNQESYLLPARRQGMEGWPADDAYVNFLRQQLEQAQAIRLAPGGVIATALSNALFDVVSLSQTPQLAAETAILAVQP